MSDQDTIQKKASEVAEATTDIVEAVVDVIAGSGEVIGALLGGVLEAFTGT